MSTLTGVDPSIHAPTEQGGSRSYGADECADAAGLDRGAYLLHYRHASAAALLRLVKQ